MKLSFTENGLIQLTPWMPLATRNSLPLPIVILILTGISVRVGDHIVYRATFLSYFGWQNCHLWQMFQSTVPSLLHSPVIVHLGIHGIVTCRWHGHRCSRHGGQKSGCLVMASQLAKQLKGTAGNDPSQKPVPTPMNLKRFPRTSPQKKCHVRYGKHL